MQSSGYAPSTGVDLSDLAPLVAAPGPVATVYLTTEADTDNASQKSLLRWRAVREAMADQGAPAGVLDGIEALVPDAHLHGSCLIAVAGPDGRLFFESHSEPPTADVGRWAALPSLGTLIEWRQGEPSHIVVVTDRQGADIVAFGRGGPDRVEEVKGTTWPIHRTGRGGWSTRHHQMNVEGNWEHNAGLVARRIEELAAETKAAVVVVAGDVRARQFLRDQLADEVAMMTVDAGSGSRGPDGSSDHLASEVVRQVATVAAAPTKAVLEKFKEERGESDRAADGPARTLEALARAQVAVLLVHDDRDDDRTAWFGPEPSQVASSRQELEAMGVAHPDQGRLVDVAIRAAIGTGADVRIVPEHGGPADRVGAILRWS